MMAKGWSTGWHARSDRIARARLKACVATTDVHEYGKILVESVLRQLDVEIIDGGISTDPNDLVDQAVTIGDFIALSSYNGVALQFFTQLKGELDARNSSLPVFVGGKLNRTPMAATRACRSISARSLPRPVRRCADPSTA